MTPQSSVARHRTAIKRTDLSRPVRLALQDGIIARGTSVFDYGCGLGFDAKRLRRRGIRCRGWDPVHQPNVEREPAEVVNLGYVVNVIENPKERVETLRRAWKLAERVLVVSARLTHEVKDTSGERFGDGVLTAHQTFQKYYQQSELREWINAVLDVKCAAAGPGVFYVFRDPEQLQSFHASRYRRRTKARPSVRKSDRLYEEHGDLLEPLIAFFEERGRLPSDLELDRDGQGEAIEDVFGSVKRAFRVVRRVTGDDRWEAISAERSQDLLIYLGLARFDGRPRFSQLPHDLRLDVRAFFSSYKRACGEADALLFSVGDEEQIDRACRQSEVGKVTPSALYVHESALDSLSPTLRVYEGCARGLIGAVEDANIIKLHRRSPTISYVEYPDFDRNPHPPLRKSLSVNLRSFRVRTRSYEESSNRPILHRKEEFVGLDYPRRDTFARLTRQEERHGLFEDTARIGREDGWTAVLAKTRLYHRGHRILRRNKSDLTRTVKPGKLT